MSAVEASAADPTRSPVAGLRISTKSPLSGRRQVPPTKSSGRSVIGVGIGDPASFERARLTIADNEM
jgi:hypothetical protein